MADNGGNFDQSSCENTPEAGFVHQESCADAQQRAVEACGFGGGPGENDCMCRAANSLAAIAEKISASIDGRIDGTCTVANGCIDAIIDRLKERFEGPAYSVERCRQMVQQHLDGTFEYAIRCGNQTVDACNATCSLGDPASEGKCCNYCGSECCECKDGSCISVPCPEEPPSEETEKKYIAWCSSETGAIAVTKEGESPPSGAFYQVGLAETEIAAIELAKANCGTTEEPDDGPPPNPNQDPNQFHIRGDACNLEYLANGQTLRHLLTHADAVNLADANKVAVQRVGAIGIEGVNIGSALEIMQSIHRMVLGGPGAMAYSLTPTIAAAIGCSNDSFITVLQMMGQINSFGNYIGTDFGKFTKPMEYALNAECRQTQLSPDQGLAAYLANSVKRQELDAYYAIAGVCKPAVKHIVEASRAKPVPLQLAVMRHRELITPQAYDTGMRQLGYTKKQDRELLWKSTFQVPTMTDIIRYMVRDADDTKLVEQFGLDTGFTEKYQKQLKKWSKDQGIPDVVAKYSWRSHWNIPSPGQLFTFWHRLRYNDAFGGKDKLEKDIRAALIQQDILPYWHEHYLAVSFHPLTRVDVRRAFNIGAMDKDQVHKSYLDQGYSDENADILTKFTEKLRDDGIISHKAVKLWIKFAIDRAEAFSRMVDAGLPDAAVEKALVDTEISFANSVYSNAFARGDISRDELVKALTDHGISASGADKVADIVAIRITNHPAVKSYAVGTIERAAAETQMLTDGLLLATADKLLNEADYAIDHAFVLQCQRGIKRRFLMGEIDSSEALSELTKRGTTNQRAVKLVDWWDCEMGSRGKHVSASKLCDWLAKGSITSFDFIDRLVTIGYSRADANNMLDDCLTHISDKRLKQARKDAEAEAKESAKYQAAQKRSAAEIARANAKLAQMREKANSMRKNREKQLMSASQKMAKKCNCDIYDSLTFMRGQQARIEREYGLNPDESLQALLVAVEAWQGGEPDGLISVITGMAATAASVPDPTAS